MHFTTFYNKMCLEKRVLCAWYSMQFWCEFTIVGKNLHNMVTRHNTPQVLQLYQHYIIYHQRFQRTLEVKVSRLIGMVR